MAVHAGPDIVNGGLVFAFDTANTQKSWRGAPVTNLAKNASNQVDWLVYNLTQTVSRSTVVANEVYRITSTTGTGLTFRIGFTNATLVNGATYTVSYRYKIISGGPVFQARDWCDTAITTTTTALPDGVFYETATGARATYDSTYRFLDFEISNNTVVEIWDLQLEERAFATPYSSAQIRSNTQALLDITGRSTITANSLSYTSNGIFTLNGTTNFISTSRIAGTGSSTSSVSWCIWTKPNGTAGNIMAMSQADPQSSWNMPPIAATGSQFRGKIWNNSYLFSPTYTIGSWYYVCLVFNYDATVSNAYQRLYLNGQQVAEQTSITYSSSGVDNHLFFGQTNPGADNTGHYSGEIAGCQVYNRALTPLEIQQNFNAMRGRFNL